MSLTTAIPPRRSGPAVLLGGPASVDHDVRPGDEPRLLRAQIESETADFLDAAPASEGDAGEELLVDLGVLHENGVHLGGEGAEAFARQMGVKFVDQKYFYTDERWQSLQKVKSSPVPLSAFGSRTRSSMNQPLRAGTGTTPAKPMTRPWSSATKQRR